ncbi:MAG: transketolase [Planctomycetota bacterium]
MSFDSTVHAKAVELAKLGYEMTSAAGSGHPTSSASLAHLVTALLYTHMRYEPANPGHACSDRLVLSEGHAVPIVYAACADLGIHLVDNGELRPMTREDAMTLREFDSPIDGHPNPLEGFPFFDSATGSLGQGLSTAAGLAIAARLDGLDKRVFCLIGDGESRQGQIWEAIDFIKDHDLKTVCPIFNCNAFGQTDAVSPQQTADTNAAKLAAAGFDVKQIDGHNPTAISEALSAHAQAQHNPDAAPVAIVAETAKGWGAASQQGNGHHGTAVKGDALQAVLDELDATGKALGAHADTKLEPPRMEPGKPEPKERMRPAPLTQALQAFGMDDVITKGKLATRKAYGVALRALGHALPDLVALDAEVSNSTFADQFKKDEKLADRFVECRIAEQNMVSVALGLNAGGKIPFCSTFGKFITRAYDQVEMALNSGGNIKLVGSHAGITLGADGPSQMSMPDVAWFGSFTTMVRSGYPGFYVVTPSDAFSAYALTAAAAEYEGCVYLRTLRPDTEFLYSDDHVFGLGGHEVLVEGRDLLICATGYMVHEANAALERLDAQGIDATIVDLYSLPFNEEALLDLANSNNGMVLTIEDNYGGGYGAHVASACAASGDGFTVEQMYVQRLPKSAKDHNQMLDYCGLSADHIVAKAMNMLELSSA